MLHLMQITKKNMKVMQRTVENVIVEWRAFCFQCNEKQKMLNFYYGYLINFKYK